MAPPPSSGGNPPAPPPAPPVSPPAPEAPTAAACTNEADFREGTVLEAEFNRNLILEPALGADKVYYKLEGRQPFAGVTPIAITSKSDGLIVERVAFSDTEFTDLVDGNVVYYGRRFTYSDSSGSRTDTIVYDPPLTRPLNMKKDEVVTRKYRMKAVSVFTPKGGVPAAPDPEQIYDLTTEFTYGGRHTLSTLLGTYETCMLYENTKATTPGKSYDRRLKFEIPAEGPLRGQAVGRQSLSGFSWQDYPVKMTYTPK
ncbi:hypothetical protein D3C71_1203360 [compost metagenome]